MTIPESQFALNISALRSFKSLCNLLNNILAFHFRSRPFNILNLSQQILLSFVVVPLGHAGYLNIFKIFVFISQNKTKRRIDTLNTCCFWQIMNPLPVISSFSCFEILSQTVTRNSVNRILFPVQDSKGATNTQNTSLSLQRSTLESLSVAET